MLIGLRVVIDPFHLRFTLVLVEENHHIVPSVTYPAFIWQRNLPPLPSIIQLQRLTLPALLNLSRKLRMPCKPIQDKWIFLIDCFFFPKLPNFIPCVWSQLVVDYLGLCRGLALETLWLAFNRFDVMPFFCLLHILPEQIEQQLFSLQGDIVIRQVDWIQNSRRFDGRH